MKCEWTTLDMIDAFVPQDGQKVEFEEYKHLFENCEGMACLDDDGTPFALFAFIPMDPSQGRKLAYTALGENLGPRRLLYAARCALKWRDQWGSYRRLEAYCFSDAVDEIHWCRYVLGMRLEGILRQYTSDGQSMYCFAWVQDGN